MNISNDTSLDTGWLRDMLRAVTPAGTGDFDATFKTDRENSGLARWSGNILVNINHDTVFPYATAWHDEYIGIIVLSIEEIVITIAAHESRHLWQMHNLGVVSEFDADGYSLRVMQAYREGRLVIGPDALPFEDEDDAEVDALSASFETEINKARAARMP